MWGGIFGAMVVPPHPAMVGSGNNQKGLKMIRNKSGVRTLIAVALTAIALPAAQANLVINGSFEDLGGGSLTSGGWGSFDSIPGWTSENGVKLEIGKASVYGVTGEDIVNVMELDSTANVVSYQGFTTIASGDYTLSFLYARRSLLGADSSSDQFIVLWNGDQLGGVIDPSSTVMTRVSFTVTAVGDGTDKLTFKGMGASDTKGAIIDGVAVVPEPTTMIAGALLLLPFGLSAVRRFRK